MRSSQSPAPGIANDEPDASLPIVARRPWGLITAVLVVDLGLAAAGAWMLNAGLGERMGPRAVPPPGAPGAAQITPIETTGRPAAPEPRSSP